VLLEVQNLTIILIIFNYNISYFLSHFTKIGSTYFVFFFSAHQLEAVLVYAFEMVHAPNLLQALLLYTDNSLYYNFGNKLKLVGVICANRTSPA